jgi:MBOAT, membrane-bound O-acyltransferase family
LESPASNIAIFMNWYFIAVAPAVAVAAALAYYPARRLGGRSRTLAWLASSAVVALSPCLIPLTSKPLRFVVSLIAITLLVKLYDVYKESQLAQRMSLQSYLAYLPNGFWLVLGRVPSRVPLNRDFRRLACVGPASLLPVFVGVGLWRRDWSAAPFAIEHALKVSAVVLAVVLIGNALAAAYRLLGGRALEPMINPIAARTPADFWRRWNRPAQQFLSEYIFMPAGGLRRPARATLVTFGMSGLVHEYVLGIAAGRVQGCQILFFALQGCAVVATARTRPSGRILPLWITGTLAFNLSSSVLFFKSVDAVLPFYWPRIP